jgi:CoA:oxalate CoA-transferase
MAFNNNKEWFSHRDPIKAILADHLTKQTTAYWLEILEKNDIWCAPVWNYDALVKQQGYKLLEMELLVTTSSGVPIQTTRFPIRVDSHMLKSKVAAPAPGEHNKEIDEKLDLAHAHSPILKAV